MGHSAVKRFTLLTLFAVLAHCALACGAGSDHGPVIGSPTGPTGPIVNEGGTFGGAGGPGQPGSNPIAGATALGTSGASNTGAGGDLFVTAGNGSAGREPFGTSGSGSDPFGIAGSPTASGGIGQF